MDQGYRVHGCQMAWALSQSGVRVAMSSLRPTECDAPWLDNMIVDWPEADESDHEAFLKSWSGPLASLRQKIARHQAMDSRELAGLIPLVRRLKPKAVVALGQHGPIMLKGLRRACPGVKTIWYAADEPVSFQLSCLRREGITALPHRAYLAALYGALQRCFARKLDGAIGVSPADTRLLKLIAGVRRSVNIPNGVDTGYFSKTTTRARAGTLVFWGRLDFEPNQDALLWFARKVWPRLVQRQPQASLKIVGKNASDKVRALGDIPGIEFVGEVDDIRPYAREAAATILPMRVGGGIKNKLLEAAAMGLPILASHKAVKGLTWPEHMSPFKLCTTPDDWVHQIERVWYDGLLANTLRHDAWTWVHHQHTWPSAALKMINFIEAIAGVQLDEYTTPPAHKLAALPNAQRLAA